MRRAIHQFKYHGEYERGRDLGRRMSDRLSTLMPSFRPGVIVPVPLHPRRYRQRGFNQSRILASEIADAIGIPIVDAVQRVKNTIPQTGLTSDARIVNLFNAFEPMESERFRIEGSRVLVVDDVTTTGATVAGVADALERAGAATIYAVTLAREQ